MAGEIIHPADEGADIKNRRDGFRDQLQFYSKSRDWPSYHRANLLHNELRWSLWLTDLSEQILKTYYPSKVEHG